MATGDLHKFGTLYVGGKPIERPTKPWPNNTGVGVMPEPGNLYYLPLKQTSSVELRDSIGEEYKIQWIEVDDNGEVLFISDRNLMFNCNYDILNNNALIKPMGNGKQITIDGSIYELFVLSPEQWNKYIGNEGNFDNLKYPNDTDLDDKVQISDYYNPHNSMWNWVACGSVYNIRLVLYPTLDILGCYGAKRLSSMQTATSDVGNNMCCYRPALRLISGSQNTPPVITPSTKDYGDLSQPIDIEYRVSDPNGDRFDITVKIDDIQKEHSSYQQDNVFALRLFRHWDGLSTGRHTIKIIANDGKESTTAFYYFTKIKINSSPVITPADKDYGVIYHPQDITYNISDSDNDNFSVTVKLNGTQKESYSNQTNKSYTFNMSQYWESLNLGYHTIEISATDTQDNTSTVQYTFYKGNRIPTIDPISLALGELKNPRDISYTINDADNNELTVVVQLDYVEKERYTRQPNGIRTFQMSRYWNDIGVGNHTITITVTDIWNKSETVNYTFIKSSSPVNPPTILSPLNGSRCESVCYVEFNIGKSPDGNSQTLQVQVADNESMQTNVKTFTALEKFVGNQWVSATSATNADINNKFRIKVTGLSGVKYLRVKASDTSNGLYAYSKVIKIRVGNVLEIKTHPSKTPKCVNKIIVLLDLSADETVTKEILVSNNANDVNPTWEKYSPDQNGNHTFKNTSKTANEWAVSTKIKILANNSNHDIIIRAVGLGII